MMTYVIEFFLQLTGKNYNIDKRIPSSLILYTLWIRLIGLLRGLIFFRTLIFAGKNIVVFGKGRIKLGKYSTICESCKIDGYAIDGVQAGQRFKLGAFSIISCTSHLSKFGKGIKFGHDCGISEFCYFGASGGIDIGDNVIMGQFVSFHSEEHSFDSLELDIKDQGVTSKGIIIGNNVWIGAKVTILDGCVIGNNCVIAAGAVVKDVFPDNCIIGGVPARVIKHI